VSMGCRRLGAALMLGCALLGANRASADRPLTNFDMVRAAAGAVAVELVGRLKPAVGGDAVVVRATGNAAGNFVVENALQAALGEAGLQVRTTADSADAILDFEVVDLGMSYVRAHRTWGIGRRSIDRDAHVRVFVRLLDQGGHNVIKVDRAEAHQRDRVGAGELPDLEDAKPSAYEKPVMPAGHWNKVVEPVVVTGIVVGLIVLFFTNQGSQ